MPKWSRPFSASRSLEGVATESLELRFGIPLPTDHLPQGAVVKYEIISTSLGDRCAIRAYNQAGGAPGVFSGDVFFPTIGLRRQGTVVCR